MPAAGGTYCDLVRRWKAIAESRRIRIHELSLDRGGALLAVEIGEPHLPAVAIAAGVHGDEPAGPWALLELVESAQLDPRLRYRLLPCTNPSGFDRKTRANAEGVDVNRTFGDSGGTPEARAVLTFHRGQDFVLSIDLHEDCDATGFYCYEYGGGEIGRNVIEALDAHGFPIDPLEVTFGMAGPLDDAHCVREWGRIVADALREAGLLGGLSYSLALARNARHTLTFETPSSGAFAERRTMHRVAARAAIAAVLEDSPSVRCK